MSSGSKGSQYVGLTTLLLMGRFFLEILEASTFWSPNSLSRPVLGQMYLLVTVILVLSVQHVTKVRMAVTRSYASLTMSFC